MLDNFYLTYAVVDNKNALSDLEKSVIKDIGKNNLVNNQSKEPQVYIHENCGDEKVVKILLTYKEGNSLNENITNPYRG
jgi:hypothetical protein